MERKYNVIIIIGVFWIIGTIGLALFIDVPSQSSRNLEIIKLFFLSIGAFGVISATYLNIYNSLESTQNIKDKIYFDKLNNSFQFFDKWDSPILKESRDLTREIEENSSKISDEELKNRILSNESLKRSVITEMNFWEGMYLSIKYNRVDEKILKDAFSKAYCTTFDRFKHSCNDLFKNNPTMIENLKNFYKDWSK
jgi:hypothetical protein